MSSSTIPASLCFPCKQFTECLKDRAEDATYKETRRHFNPDDADEGTEDFTLHHAVSLGHRECVEQILHEGWDVNLHSKLSKRTPLIVAARHNHSDMVEQLLAAGANVNVKDTLEKSALWYAASEGNISIVRTLLNANAEYAYIDKYTRQTPLIAAAWGAHVECMEALVQKGAKFNLFSNGDWYLYGMAITQTSVEKICKILEMMQEQEGALREDFFLNCVLKNSVMLLRQFFSGKFKIKSTAHDLVDYNAALHTATDNECDMSVTCLLNHKDKLNIDVNYHKNTKTKTCLQKACESNVAWIVGELLGNGASPELVGNIDDSNAKPPIFSILSRLARHRQGLFSLNCLIMYGCNLERRWPVNIRGMPDKVHLTPLEYALCGNNLYAARMLVIGGACNYNPTYGGMKLRRRLVHQSLQCTKKEKEEFINEQLGGPHSLYSICRSAIRKIIKGRAIREIEKLPVAKHVKDFLCYKDLDEIALDFERDMAISHYTTSSEDDDEESIESNSDISDSFSDTSNGSSPSEDDDDDDDDDDEDDFNPYEDQFFFSVNPADYGIHYE